MIPRKRFSRKDLKQPDEFVTTSEKLLGLIKAKQSMIISIGFGILLLGGITGFFLKNRQVQAMRMELVLHKMKQLRLQGKGTEVLEKYLENFSKGAHKSRAKMILANAYFQEEKFGDAVAG